ncbi:hypothetical protein B6C97_11320 [Gilliamella apis]|nr:hypothetical protein B6C88_11430 [Gilliamella apis]OTQ36596.1 hypothetical protein B6C84_02520 [Gilliamella apis]OTQ38534.1 hypothetical protein B6D26_11290 [Gilliamella apis]OTQ39811.1 hypothetical protein B6C94_11105 [Gilliamella apis]OTQ46730.1 hypothetical protein B6C92_11085 [Gilliamella apis]
MVVLQSISFANYALTTTTTNIIYGSAPYLTFDGGRTRVTNTEALLGISLSDGRTFTPTTNNSSSTNPIELPVEGQSFADIGMLVPTDTDSIALSSLIGTPYNYWGDDDGDGQGVNGVTATGSLYLSIADKDNNPVARNEVLTICKAPYKLTLSNDEGTLKTRYGVPNESRFTEGNATYYINPKETQICFAKPMLHLAFYGAPYSDLFTPGILEDRNKGFITQSFTPSSYGSNFPTTGAHNLYFDLKIFGTNQVLSWAPVSHGGITATMTNSTSTSVRVTLTGPVATESQQQSENPGRIDKPSLPQVFELVGRDSSGNAVVKYGFELKQWFVHRGLDSRGDYGHNYYSASSWCNKIGGYRMAKVKDLTNASCQGVNSNTSFCQNYGNEIVAATPSSPQNSYKLYIGAGFMSEWSNVAFYTGFDLTWQWFYYWTNDKPELINNKAFTINVMGSVGVMDLNVTYEMVGICTYP